MKLNFCLSLLFLFGLSRASAQTTYKDVTPIFISNCNSCHHSGGIAFSLTKYSEVFSKGLSIKNAVNANSMPPWPPDPTYKSYVHERVVNATDKAALINWIDNGMLAGDTTLAPQPPVYGATQLNGTPDLVLNVTKFTSTAAIEDHYYCLNVPTGLSQDRYIRAFEFVPGNAALIHHAVITIDTLGTAVDDLSGNCFNFQGQINIGDFAPGMGPTVLPGVSPAKFGFRLKAGSKISFQIHVPEGTVGEKDSSQLRIYFYPPGEIGIREMFFQTVLQNWAFVVPPNDSITVTAKYPSGSAGLPIDVSLYGAFPHSHKTCTSIINFAYKNTDTIPLIRIPHWDFHWQGQYTFKKMVKVPQSYKLFAAHKFDNTVNNPHTPDPNQAVQAGTNTYDEMLFDSYLYTLYQSGDENIDIEALLLNDPLFCPLSVSDVESNPIQLKISPNPFEEETKIEYSLPSAQFVKVQIYNEYGQVVAQLASGIEGAGLHTHFWNAHTNNGQHAAPGMYFCKVQAGKSSISQKIILR